MSGGRIEKIRAHVSADAFARGNPELHHEGRVLLKSAGELDVKTGTIAEGEGGDLGGQRIEQVGGAIPAGVTVLDLGGRSLLAGLIDG